ncbi:MAG: serine/threonine-protein kinase [Chloroflexota bacterium]
MNAKPDTLNKRDTSSNTLLIGWRLWIAWSLWMATAIMAFCALLGTIPQFVEEAQHGGPYAEFIVQSGVSPSVFFPLDFSLSIIQLTVWYLVAIFIFYKKPNDWLALTTSIMILANGYFVASFDQVFAYYQTVPKLMFLYDLTWFLDIVNYGSGLMFFGNFPDGRFAPRWLKPIYIFLFTYIAVEDVVIVVDPNISHYSNFSTFLRVIVLCGLLIFAQLYRLRQISVMQRQQTKLAVIGLVMGVIGNIIDKLLVLQFGQTSYLIIRPIVFTLYICAAVCFTYAILRHRLWDIDFAINRSLVYGILTALLGAVFAGGFFAVRALMETIFESRQDLIAVAVPAVAITALFTPTRNSMRRFVDKRFYGIELDYKKIADDRALRKRQLQHTLEPITSFGMFSDLELIGRGGMGEVYRAKHPTLNCDVAIKILPKHLAENEVAYWRYNHEAQAIVQLKHPNIVGMYDYGIMDGIPYIVLEYVNGRTLSEELNQRGRLSLADALPIFTGIASALDYSHTAGIVHRDIKPSNVMIERDTDSRKSPRAVLMDFGIAKLHSSMTQLTGTGVLVGTLDYVSPEQIQGASEVDAQADIYSFGVMVFQALTGALPFEHKNISALLMAHLMRPVPDPRELVPDLPEAAAKAIMRAMAKEPGARQKGAGDFITEMISPCD